MYSGIHLVSSRTMFRLCKPSTLSIAILALLVALLIAACGDDDAPSAPTSTATAFAMPEAYRIGGSVQRPALSIGTPCFTGAEQVIVVNEAGVTIGTGTTAIVSSTPVPTDRFGGAACMRSYDVAVPRATFYKVNIGTHPGPTVSFAEISGKGWRLDLEIR